MKTALTIASVIVLGVLIGLPLAGCAHAPINWQKAGATPQDLTQDRAACRLVMRQMPTSNDTGLSASLATMAAMQEQYQDCMLAKGWTADNL